MKKVLCILAATAMVIGVQAAEDVKTDEVGQLGVGYQGQFFSGANNVGLNALSIRWSPEPIGGQLLIGRKTQEIGGADNSATTLEAKLFYSLIQRKQSQFYVGGKFGLLFGETLAGADAEGTVFGALAGTEWRFSELPEIGFNFELGYDFASEDIVPDSTGIVVSLGAHYYF